MVRDSTVGKHSRNNPARGNIRKYIGQRSNEHEEADYQVYIDGSIKKGEVDGGVGLCDIQQGRHNHSGQEGSRCPV